MGLYLKVLRFGDDFLDYDLSATIGKDGGSIGRAQGNSLVLPDKEGYVSRIHSKIENHGETFSLVDCSSNGTVILEPIPGDVEGSFNEIFVHQAKRDLVDDSYLLIGDFEIEVKYREEVLQAAVVDDQFDLHELDSSPSANKVATQVDIEQPVFVPPAAGVVTENKEAFESGLAANESVLQDNFATPSFKAPPDAVDQMPEGFDIDDFFSSEEDVPAASVAKPGETDEDDIFAALQNPFEDESIAGSSQAQDIAVAAEVKEDVSTIDATFESNEAQHQESISSPQVEAVEPDSFVAESMPVEQEKMAIPPASAPLVKQHEQLAIKKDCSEAFFKGLGIEAEKIPDNQETLDLLMLNAGKMLRTLLENNISLLQARADMKREFSAAVTVIKKEENNPLKFCQTVDEALPYLFLQNVPGFLPAETAVEESVYDLCSHQMAMMAGIQAALKGAVNKFDPMVIEKSCDAGHFNKGSKYWEFYSSNYNKISTDALSDFFGSDFAEAYERQTRAMKNTR